MTMGVRVAWVLLALLVGVVSCGKPTPEAVVNKRSAEDIQFGNQQNLPIGLLDDNALPGAFPSSETSEEAVEMKEGQKKEEEHQPPPQPQQQTNKNNNDNPSKDGTGTKQVTDETKEGKKQQEQKREVEVESERREEKRGQLGGGGGGLLGDRRWYQETAFPTLHYYRPHWGVPRLYTSPVFSLRRRRRRSLRLPSAILNHRSKKSSHRSLAGLRNLMRARGEVGDEGETEGRVSVRRQKRGAMDLDELLKEVDVVDLITLLSRPTHQQAQHRHNFYRSGGGFGTVRYAPVPPRFAPQPKPFPDYDENEGVADGAPLGGMGLLKQNVRAAHHIPEAVMVPAGGSSSGGGGRRVWRRSGGGASGMAGYGLSAVPGFKRSVFRANNNNNSPPPPPPQLQYLNPGDVYSLAAMLGAELDPVTHRLRRAAM